MLALALVAAAVIVWAAAFHLPAGHEADAWLLDLGNRLDDTPVEFFFERVVNLIDIPIYAVLCAIVIGVLVAERGWGAAIAGAALILGANLTTQALKHGLAEPRFHERLDRQIDPVSWPSGHATAALALGLALLLVRPGARLLVAAFALTIGAAVVSNHWHYPSDVLGGYFVAGAWGAGAAALLRRRRPAATAAPRRRWLRATG